MAGALEIASGAENLPECHTYGFLGPRISFSTDFGLLDSSPDHPQQQHIEWSTEFDFGLSIEQQPGSPADEIFSDGKLLPLHLLGPSSRIQMVRKLLDGDSLSSTEQSRESSLCPSPIINPGSAPPSNPGSGVSIQRRRSSSYSLKLVRLFRKSLGESGKSVDGEPQKSTVLFPGKIEAESPPGESKGEKNKLSPPTRSEFLHAGDAEAPSSSSSLSRKLSSCSVNSSGRILWRNLERCSRSCAEQKRLRSAVRRNSSEKNPGASAFSSNVRVAPVLNVPICMGPVKDKGSNIGNGSGGNPSGTGSSSSTIAGQLRKLLIGKRSFQRVTWACPGGTIS